VVGETADRGELTGDPFSPPSVSVACGNWRFYFGPPTVRFDRQGAHRKSVVHAETVIPGGTRRLLGSRAVSVPSLGSHRRLGDWARWPTNREHTSPQANRPWDFPIRLLRERQTLYRVSRAHYGALLRGGSGNGRSASRSSSTPHPTVGSGRHADSAQHAANGEMVGLWLVERLRMDLQESVDHPLCNLLGGEVTYPVGDLGGGKPWRPPPDFGELAFLDVP
jgi:hypothetical protein